MSDVQGLGTVCLYFEASTWFFVLLKNKRTNPTDGVSKKGSNMLDASSYNFQTEIQHIRCKKYLWLNKTCKRTSFLLRIQTVWTVVHVNTLSRLHSWGYQISTWNRPHCTPSPHSRPSIFGFNGITAELLAKVTLVNQTALQPSDLTFRHCASCFIGQTFRSSPENAFYVFNQQIYFII